MLSIQIDTESLELVILPSVQQHQIVLLCKPYEIEFFIAVRLLDTLALYVLTITSWILSGSYFFTNGKSRCWKMAF